MTGNEGTVHIAAIVAKATGMKDFKMAGSRFFCEGAIMLAEALSKGTSLERLDLNDNNVNEEGAKLAKVLPKHPNLEFLNFEATALGPDMGGTFCRQWRRVVRSLKSFTLAATTLSERARRAAELSRR